MIADAEYDSRDDRVLPQFDVADLAAETVSAYRNYFRSTRRDHPWLTLADDAFLRQLGAFRRDRETGAEGLTAAGLLMFGQYDRIREAFPNYFPDYQERPRVTGAIEWTDRVFADGTWSGNLYDFYRKVVLKLTADLKIPFHLRKDLYRTDDTHIHEAIREALVNALIHADLLSEDVDLDVTTLRLSTTSLLPALLVEDLERTALSSGICQATAEWPWRSPPTREASPTSA